MNTNNTHISTHQEARNSIPATPYAASYQCRLTDPENSILTPQDLDLLSHVNCTYLSSGTPPTLLALKQHAQSLAILIRKLSVSTTFGFINGRNATTSAYNDGHDEQHHVLFHENEAFDWLNDLDTPYQNHDVYHHTPLWMLANQVSSECEIKGPEHHCPLQEAKDFGPLAHATPKDQRPPTRRPYATHHNLLMHANSCLEVLDHEYSATGGLLSILPTDEVHDTHQMTGARNTLVGQWLLHHQHLVARMHELELSYANAIDLTAGEAIVPLQLLSEAVGAKAQSVSDLTGPQARFVLANTGDPVFSQIHALMDQEESKIQQRDSLWDERGVIGDRMWATDDATRGLISVDLTSRFYRVKGTGSSSTIFVLPAIYEHPDVTATRAIEKRPTVVVVPEPRWPTRVSDWEDRFRRELGRISDLEVQNTQLKSRLVRALQGQVNVSNQLLNLQSRMKPANS